MKRIYIVTGANGFLGNNIVRKLVQNKENEVRALVLPDDKINSLEGLDCKIYYGDVTKLETLEDIFKIEEDAELCVIHCAAIVYIKSKYNPKVYDVNVNGTKNVIEKVLEKNAKLVYVNSVHAITEKPNNELMTEINYFEPEKVKGQYWITDYDKDYEPRRLLRIEAIDKNWHVKCNEIVKILDNENRPKDIAKLSVNSFYNLYIMLRAVRHADSRIQKAEIIIYLSYSSNSRTRIMRCCFLIY